MNKEVFPQPESTRVVSFDEFTADPEAVIDQANTTEQSFVVTRHGRFLFLVEPIESLDIQLPETDTSSSGGHRRGASLVDIVGEEKAKEIVMRFKDQRDAGRRRARERRQGG